MHKAAGKLAGEPIPSYKMKIKVNKSTISPNTKEKIYGNKNFGHKDDHQWVDYQNDPLNQNKSREQINDEQNDPSIYQIEGGKPNSSKGGKRGNEIKKQNKNE